MKRIDLTTVLLFILFFSCKKDPNELYKTPEKILFIGNSYTFFNNGLEYHLKKYIAEDTLIRITSVEEIAKGGYTLENHWNDTATINKITSRVWDIIILQEQSYRPVNEKEKMITYVEKFDSLIKSTGETKLFLFMTWAYKDYPEMVYPLSESYNEAAKNLRAAVVPVGWAWDELIKSNDTLNLYYSDGQHPNIIGTFYTASIFYKILFHNDPRINEYKDSLVSEKTATLLKEWANGIEEIQY